MTAFRVAVLPLWQQQNDNNKDVSKWSTQDAFRDIYDKIGRFVVWWKSKIINVQTWNKPFTILLDWSYAADASGSVLVCQQIVMQLSENVLYSRVVDSRRASHCRVQFIFDRSSCHEDCTSGVWQAYRIHIGECWSKTWRTSSRWSVVNSPTTCHHESPGRPPTSSSSIHHSDLPPAAQRRSALPSCPAVCSDVH